jgi:hypothetical protein
MMAMYFLFGCIVSETPAGVVKNLLSLLLVIEHFLKQIVGDFYPIHQVW